MSTLITAKIIFAVSIFITTVIACFLPFLVGNIIKRNLYVFCSCNGFAGGVLLGAGMIHMLPEAEENLEGDFPWAHVICTSGYIITYFIESFAFHGGVGHKQEHVVAATKAAERKKRTTLCIADMDSTIIIGEENADVVKSPSHFRTFHSNDGEVRSPSTIEPSLLPTISEDNFIEPMIAKRSSAKSGVFCSKDSHGHENFAHRHSLSTRKLSRSTDIQSVSNFDEHVHDVHLHNIEFEGKSALTAIILCLALSFHSVIAGMALGITDAWAEYWAVVIAIASHKFVTSFTLGLRFLQTMGDDVKKIPVKTVIIQFVFALMVPIGAAVGIILHKIIDTTESTFPSALQALSAGCFLYIGILTITEATDGLPSKHKLTKFFFIASGVGFMCYVKTLE